MATQNTQTRTAMVDGKEMEAGKAAAIHEVKDIFDKLRKALKTIALYRHNVDRYGEYLEPVHTALADFLDRKQSLELKVDAVSYRYKGSTVFVDESRDNNMVYPFWQAGVRLFIFKAGISPDELLEFLLLGLKDTEERQKRGEDIITRLWKAEFDHIEYVVVEGFRAVADEDYEEVEVEIEQVVAYLYRQLQSNSDDYLRFARISVKDLELELNDIDQLRGAVIQGTTATAADKMRVQDALAGEGERVLPKLITVFFQLLELDTTEENFDDVAEAFVQLLDALLIGEKFTAIHQIRQRFKRSLEKAHLTPDTKTLIELCSNRFDAKMAEAQRLQMIGQILNQGVVKDVDGLKQYLFALGEEAVPPLLDLLENLELLPNRRLICDVLAQIGRRHVDFFTSRLTHPSSNLVKDILYLLDQINPPDKFDIFAQVLEHPNAILRLETLSLIGKDPSERCFTIIRDTLFGHEDAQLRAQAARSLPNFDPHWAGPTILEAAKPERLEKMGGPEQKAVYIAIAQIRSAETEAFVREVFEQKSGMLKRKVDDAKMLMIIGLEGFPSLGSLQLLAEIAQDKKRHTKEVCEAARAAAVQMQAKLAG